MLCTHDATKFSAHPFVSRLQDLRGRPPGGGGRGDPAGLPIHHLPGSPRGALGGKGWQVNGRCWGNGGGNGWEVVVKCWGY